MPLAMDAVVSYMPPFMSHGIGACTYDEDGRKYVDFLGGFGANVLGYCDPRVEDAANAQGARGNTLTFPTARGIDLAERLISLMAGADWCMYGKNGSDATSAALTVARAYTGRRVVLRSKHVEGKADHWAYHGTGSHWQVVLESFLSHD